MTRQAPVLSLYNELGSKSSICFVHDENVFLAFGVSTKCERAPQEES